MKNRSAPFAKLSRTLHYIKKPAIVLVFCFLAHHFLPGAAQPKMANSGVAAITNGDISIKKLRVEAAPVLKRF